MCDRLSFRIKKVEKMEKKEIKNLIEAAIDGLVYISESDSAFSFFESGKFTDANIEVNDANIEVNLETIRKCLKIGRSVLIEERNFGEFFSRLTSVKDWFGEREKKIAERFQILKSLLDENLREVKVFRIGKIQIDIYVVGLDIENRLVGIKTKAIET